MLLLHHHSLGDIIETQKGKNKENKSKNIFAWPWATRIPGLWFLLCWFKVFAWKTKLLFFLVCSVRVSNSLWPYNSRLLSHNILMGSCLLSASVWNLQGKWGFGRRWPWGWCSLVPSLAKQQGQCREDMN